MYHHSMFVGESQKVAQKRTSSWSWLREMAVNRINGGRNKLFPHNLSVNDQENIMIMTLKKRLCWMERLSTKTNRGYYGGVNLGSPWSGDKKEKNSTEKEEKKENFGFPSPHTCNIRFFTRYFVLMPFSGKENKHLYSQTSTQSKWFQSEYSIHSAHSVAFDILTHSVYTYECVRWW